jgi:hypothetical protein
MGFAWNTAARTFASTALKCDQLTSGTHTITATYNGSTSFSGSSSSVTQIVN